jgi:hypothetical protein
VRLSGRGIPLTPAWKALAGGCHLARPIPDLIRQGGFEIEKMETIATEVGRLVSNVPGMTRQPPNPQLAPLVPPVPQLAVRPPRRDSRSDRLRACLKPEARALLDRIEAEFGPMEIISTCRPGARIAGTGRISKHATGEAIDFNAGSRKGDVVRWLIANHRSGGTMTYAGMGHIHVDIGPRFVSLNSGGGRYR